jgi:hypothetical protein
MYQWANNTRTQVLNSSLNENAPDYPEWPIFTAEAALSYRIKSASSIRGWKIILMSYSGSLISARMISMMRWWAMRRQEGSPIQS